MLRNAQHDNVGWLGLDMAGICLIDSLQQLPCQCGTAGEYICADVVNRIGGSVPGRYGLAVTQQCAKPNRAQSVAGAHT